MVLQGRREGVAPEYIRCPRFWILLVRICFSFLAIGDNTDHNMAGRSGIDRFDWTRRTKRVTFETSVK